MAEKMKILYFMPDPPTQRNHGNRTHAMQLLEYFKSRSSFFEVDYVAIKEWGWADKDKQDFHDCFPNFGLKVLERDKPKKKKLKYWTSYVLPNKIRKRRLGVKGAQIDDLTNIYLQGQFNEFMMHKSYDVIIMSYVTWSSLLQDCPYINGAKLINDTHDFITALYKGRPGFQLGKAFQREMEILSRFDEVWSQSADEQYLFSQFLNAKLRFIPIMLDEGWAKTKKQLVTPEYDLVYVASDNDNNKNSANWFLTNVYPLLPQNLNICFIGLICNHVPDLPNVKKFHFVDDLGAYYKKSKMAICPMLHGSGVKVKVVEALSFGLPVVCTLRGVDGLPSKIKNGCIVADSAATFAQWTIDVLSNDQLYDELRAESKSFFSKFFTKEKGYETLDSVFDLKIEKKELSKGEVDDLHTEQIIKSICKKDSNCVDIGANKGDILSMIQNIAPKGIHYAFEPIPDMVENLKQKFTNDNIRIFDIALSSQKGVSSFNYVISNPAYSGLIKRRYDREHEDDTLIEVKTDLLDSILPEDHKVDLIKIDVEGGELPVLKGSINTLKKYKPVVIFEHGTGSSEFYGTTPEDLFDLMHDCGLKIYTLVNWLQSENALTKEELRQLFDSNEEYNFVASA